jgi:DNA-directed RNA polymerase subunit N (RpoN/RPB10)
MLYMVCPTCGTLLGNKQLVYEKKIEELDNKKLDMNAVIKEKEKIINSLGINKYRTCCRQRIVGYIDTIMLVK